jgi:crotonobetainyl-CoA:carnitine CoA-transferase CaiB-like acyl-CoA transferase
LAFGSVASKSFSFGRINEDETGVVIAMSEHECGFLDEFRGDGPLRDVTVLDFTQMMLGPLATQLLGDMGALIIKVEPPGKGEFERSCLTRGRRFEGESPHFLAMNRNKLSLAANLKNADDRELVLALVEHCDAVVNNFRPGVMERLELGYEALCERNSRIVFAQGTGYGPSGPMADRPGQDLLVQAMSGLAANTGTEDGPPVALASAICDAAGAFLLAFSITAAIQGARRTGEPQRVDVSLLGTALLIQCLEAFMTMNMQEMTLSRSHTGLAAPWLEAPYGFYRTADGWISVSMTPRDRLVDLFGLPPELLDLDHDDWYSRRDEVNAQLARVLSGRTTEDWLALFAEHDIWAAPLLSLAEVLSHPQVEANGFVETIPLGAGRGDAQAVGLVTQVSSVRTARRLPPPRLGEHNEIIRRAISQ